MHKLLLAFTFVFTVVSQSSVAMNSLLIFPFETQENVTESKNQFDSLLALANEQNISQTTSDEDLEKFFNTDDENNKTDSEFTLHAAVKQGDIANVYALLTKQAKQADPCLKDKDGNTALAIAEKELTEAYDYKSGVNIQKIHTYVVIIGLLYCAMLPVPK